MTIIKCRECKQDVSNQASACPHCGIKDPANNNARGCLAVIVMAIIFGLGMATCTSNDKPEGCAADDLQCHGDALSYTAGILCKKPIESMAKYSANWTDTTLEQKFSRFRWKDKEAGTITMIGDKVQFQNGFGANTNMIYECDIAKDGKTVLDVRIKPGVIE